MKLEGEAKLKRIPKQEYTVEFRELAVKRENEILKKAAAYFSAFFIRKAGNWR